LNFCEYFVDANNALYSHLGSWQTNTTRRGYEFNNQLLSVITDAHKGKSSPLQSFVQLQPSNLVLTTVKKAEESNAWVFQWYDAVGEGTETVLTLPQEPKKVVTSNFLEEDGAVINFEKKTVKLKTAKNSIVTVKVYF
jgi:alpha-mannosidase